MLSNINSRIDEMKPTTPGAPDKRSINLFNAEEEEIDALSFERIGVNTIHYKDRTSIVSAKYCDVTTCLGEIRPGTGIAFNLTNLYSLYPTEDQGFLDEIPENSGLGELKTSDTIMYLFVKLNYMQDIEGQPSQQVSLDGYVLAARVGDKVVGLSTINGNNRAMLKIYTELADNDITFKIYKSDADPASKLIDSSTTLTVKPNDIMGTPEEPIDLSFGSIAFKTLNITCDIRGLNISLNGVIIDDEAATTNGMYVTKSPGVYAIVSDDYSFSPESFYWDGMDDVNVNFVGALIPKLTITCDVGGIAIACNDVSIDRANTDTPYVALVAGKYTLISEAYTFDPKSYEWDGVDDDSVEFVGTPVEE